MKRIAFASALFLAALSSRAATIEQYLAYVLEQGGDPISAVATGAIAFSDDGLGNSVPVAWGLSISQPQEAALPGYAESVVALRDLVATNAAVVLAADADVSPLVLPPADALPGNDPANIPPWVLKFSRTCECYEFYPDATLATKWSERTEYSNLLQRVAAVRDLGEFSLAFGSAYDSNAVPPYAAVRVNEDVLPALAEAAASTNHAAMLGALVSLESHRRAGGDPAANGLLLEDTNCLWLSTGPYRSP